MSSADLFEDGFPHGTREGYDKGCHGGSCPEAIEGRTTCRDAVKRYAGDQVYRHRVNAGMTPMQIAEQEAEDARVDRIAGPSRQPAAPRKAPVATPKQAVVPTPPPAPVVSPPHRATDDEVVADPDAKPYMLTDVEVARMVDLHTEGVSDGAIAEDLGRSQANISRKLRKMGLPANGKGAKPTDVEPPDAIQERSQEVRADGLIAELEEVRSQLDKAHSDVSIEKAARETLGEQVAELTRLRVEADTGRETAERRVSELTDQVATLTLELDVAKSPDAVPSGAGLALVPPAPVATAEEARPPARAGAVGLDIQQLGDALSVRLHGGEPVHLNLQFENGALSDVGVKIGA